MPINKEQTMQDAVNAICKLDFKQLITLNAQLSEHLFNVIQHTELAKAREEKKEG